MPSPPAHHRGDDEADGDDRLPPARPSRSYASGGWTWIHSPPPYLVADPAVGRGGVMPLMMADPLWHAAGERVADVPAEAGKRADLRGDGQPAISVSSSIAFATFPRAHAYPFPPRPPTPPRPPPHQSFPPSTWPPRPPPQQPFTIDGMDRHGGHENEMHSFEGVGRGRRRDDVDGQESSSHRSYSGHRSMLKGKFELIHKLRAEIKGKLKLDNSVNRLPLSETETLRFDEKGRLMVWENDHEVYEVKEEAQREAERGITFWASRGEMTRVFGKQITQYFNFLSFLTCVNAALMLSSLIVIIPHLSNILKRLHDEGFDTLDITSSAASFDYFFLGSLQPSDDRFWDAYMITSCAVGLLSGPLYFLASTFILVDFDSISEVSERTIKDPMYDYIHRPDQKGESLKKFKQKLRESRPVRLATSYSLFVFLLCVPITIMFALLIGANYAYVNFMKASQDFEPLSLATSGSEWGNQQIFIGVMLALTVVIFNAIFEQIVGKMTEWERHKTWSSYRNHRMWKLLVFRFVNTSSLFVLRYFGEVPWFTCIVNRMALQAGLLMVTDLFVANIWTMIFPLFFVGGTCLCQGDIRERFRQGKLASDCKEIWARRFFSPCCFPAKYDVGAEFELTDEYLKLMFRQYLIYIAFPVFPFISCLALTSTLFDHMHSKLRLAHFCRKPKGIFFGARKRLSIWLFLAFFAGISTFPIGAFWFAGASGPFLCWPCPGYSKASAGSMSSGAVGVGGGGQGVCAASFEAPECQDRFGNPLASGQVMSRINAVRAGDAESSRWLDENEHLFKHKRCACRPCNLAISCSCSTPTLQSRVCDPLTAGKLDIGEWDAEIVWRASHCDRPRSSYSSKGYASHAPTCAGGAKDGFPCTSSADCGPGGYCDGHCPSLLIDRGGGDLKWAEYPNCWICPEDLNGGFVDPRIAKEAWSGVGFCKRCTSPGVNTCVCSKTCSDFSVIPVQGLDA